MDGMAFLRWMDKQYGWFAISDLIYSGEAGNFVDFKGDEEQRLRYRYAVLYVQCCVALCCTASGMLADKAKRQLFTTEKVKEDHAYASLRRSHFKFLIPSPRCC